MITTHKQSYLKVFWELLKTDLSIYKQPIKDAVVDASIWFTCLIVIFAYVYPSIGMTQQFGVFMAVGAIVSCCFWDIWSTTTTFVSDIEGNKTIDYFLTLPIPNFLVLIKQIISYALKAGIPSLIILPLGKLFLWNQMSLAHFSLLRFILIYLLINIFIGAFSLFVTSKIQNLHHMGKVGIRYLFPLWFFGGSNFSWNMIHNLSPIFSYSCLLNPLLYAMEGIRAAVLGQEGYISYWICSVMLTGFIILFSFLGIKNLKTRLDFV